MALKNQHGWMTSIVFLTLMVTTLSKISKLKKVIHGHSKMENFTERAFEQMIPRKLLGRFTGSKMIDSEKNKVAFKSVKNLQQGFSLPPGRKLQAIVSKSRVALKKSKDYGISEKERQLRNKHGWKL